MRSSGRKKKEVTIEEPPNVEMEMEEEGNGGGDAKFAPDHLFFDDSFTPVVEKILGRKLVQNEKDETEELFFIKVLHNMSSFIAYNENIAAVAIFVVLAFKLGEKRRH